MLEGVQPLLRLAPRTVLLRPAEGIGQVAIRVHRRSGGSLRFGCGSRVLHLTPQPRVVQFLQRPQKDRFVVPRWSLLRLNSRDRVLGSARSEEQADGFQPYGRSDDQDRRGGSGRQQPSDHALPSFECRKTRPGCYSGE
jgi:hypothetical protein